MARRRRITGSVGTWIGPFHVYLTGRGNVRVSTRLFGVRRPR